MRVVFDDKHGLTDRLIMCGPKDGTVTAIQYGQVKRSLPLGWTYLAETSLQWRLSRWLRGAQAPKSTRRISLGVKRRCTRVGYEEELNHQSEL